MTVYAHEGACGHKEFRRVLDGKRILIHSAKELEYWRKEIVDTRKMDFGISVFVFAGESDAEIIAGNFSIIYDCIYIDLDHKDISVAHEDLKRIVLWGRRKGWKIRCRFSAAKGFHMYTDFLPYSTFNTKGLLAESTRQIIREIEEDTNIQLEKILERKIKPEEKFEMQSVDTGFFGDIRRVMRVPNSINTKSGLYCIDLKEEEVLNLSIEEIKALAKTPRPLLHRKEFQKANGNKPHEWLSECELRVAGQTTFRKRGTVKEFPVCEGVSNALKGVGSGMRDYTLTGLIHFFKSHGMNEKQIVDALINWNKINTPPMPDFIIRNKVNYHMTRDFSPCTFFAKIGLCKNCVVYRRIIGAEK